MKINKKPLRPTDGFTLIELLVVIAIIAILASVILVGLGSARKLARDSKRIADLQSVRTSLELYFNTCQSYPGGTVGAGSPADCASVSDPYGMEGKATWGINKLPRDPLTGVVYSYCVVAPGVKYTLMATLEDSANSALTQSAKTSACGLNCTGSNYCLEP